jgi:glyoxylase-like metal-dependent hydrolase (beta-lactamase superfamily II)
MADFHKPVKLAENMWRLPVWGKNAINAFLYVNENNQVILIDCGLKGSTPKLVKCLEALGRSPEEVSKILLTHAHGDHVGSVNNLRNLGAFKNGVHIHEKDAKFLEQGKSPPMGSHTILAPVFSLFAPGIPKSNIDGFFKDGELIEDFRVLYTPGHSPGHCSFLNEKNGVLITGDSIVNLMSKIAYSFAWFCSNFSQCKETAIKLAEADYETAAFTHGPEIKKDARNSIREFLKIRKD